MKYLIVLFPFQVMTNIASVAANLVEQVTLLNFVKLLFAGRFDLQFLFQIQLVVPDYIDALLVCYR